MADLPSDITHSSGSDYDVNKDLALGLDSSDEAVFLIRKNSRGGPRPKKTRFEALPSYAKSTPRDDIYAFSEDENQTEQFIRRRVQPTVTDWQNTPTTTAQKNITLDDVMNRMTAMESTLLGAIRELTTQNENLRKENERRATKIDQLANRVDQLETRGTRQTDKDPQTRASNHVRAALRTALKHAEEEKGMEVQVNDGMDAPCNKNIVQYVHTFAKVHIPDMTESSFRAGFNTILRSRKQKISRKRTGKEDQHSNVMRKIQRKTVKSQNRVLGLDASDLPGEIKRK